MTALSRARPAQADAGLWAPAVTVAVGLHLAAAVWLAPRLPDAPAPGPGTEIRVERVALDVAPPAGGQAQVGGTPRPGVRAQDAASPVPVRAAPGGAAGPAPQDARAARAVPPPARPSTAASATPTPVAAPQTRRADTARPGSAGGAAPAATAGTTAPADGTAPLSTPAPRAGASAVAAAGSTATAAAPARRVGASAAAGGVPPTQATRPVAAPSDAAAPRPETGSPEVARAGDASRAAASAGALRAAPTARPAPGAERLAAPAAAPAAPVRSVAPRPEPSLEGALRLIGGRDCRVAQPGGSAAAPLRAFAFDAGAVEALTTGLAAILADPPPVVRQPVTIDQCAALDFVAAGPGAPDVALRLRAAEVAPGGWIEGEIVAPRSARVTLLTVGPDGRVGRVGAFALTRVGGGVLFRLPAPAAGPLLLVALAAEGDLETPARLEGAGAARFFDALAAEAGAGGIGVARALEAVAVAPR